MTVAVRRVGAESADAVLEVIGAAFGPRPPLHPPATALAETPESVACALREHGGLVAEAAGQVVGALLFSPEDDLLGLRRFGVRPEQQHSGVAALLVEAATEVGIDEGYAGLVVGARPELPRTIGFWRSHGFAEISHSPPHVHMVRRFPWVHEVPEAEDARSLASSLATLLRPGDLLILSGGLGAGKTTFTQGLGAGLQVRGDITSPTFVIARVHPSLVDGPALVHVDAYRLGGIAELDDLDLDTSLDDAVTVVEWGEGVAESLAADRLEIRIVRAVGGAGANTGEDVDPRRIEITPVGPRWSGVPGPGSRWRVIGSRPAV